MTATQSSSFTLPSSIPSSAACFARAAKTYHAEARVQRRAAAVAAELLRDVSEGPFTSMLELGCGTGAMTEALLPHLSPDARLTLTDAAPAMTEALQTRIGAKLPDDTTLAVATMEGIAAHEGVRRRGSFDLIALGSVLQWAEDPTAVLATLRGLRDEAAPSRLVFTAYAAGTLQEVRSLTGTGLPLLTAEGWVKAAEAAGWTVLRRYAWETVEFFPDAQHMLRHLSVTGVNGAPAAGRVKCSAGGAPARMTPGQLRDFLAAYDERFMTSSGVRLTWRPVAMVVG